MPSMPGAPGVPSRWRRIQASLLGVEVDELASRHRNGHTGYPREQSFLRERQGARRSRSHSQGRSTSPPRPRARSGDDAHVRSGHSEQSGSVLESSRAPSSTAASVLEVGEHGTFAVSRKWMTSRPLLTKGSKFTVYLQDLFFSTVHLNWWKLTPLVAMLYFTSWCCHGSIAFVSDHFYGNPPSEHPCVSNAKTFTHYLYWSAVTMSTVGYGDMTPNCPIAYTQLPVMLVHGGILDAMVFGIIYAKFSTPARRGKTLLTSKSICGRIWLPVPTNLDAPAESWKSAVSTLQIPSLSIQERGTGESALSISFRILNVRDHAVMRPELSVFLVDHLPLIAHGDAPCFHPVPFDVQPPMHFLEFPCTVTCNFCSSRGSDASASPTPLHDILRDVSVSGIPDLNYEHKSRLQSLSLVAVFSASETATGSCFEIRNTWSLSDVQWGHRFVPMLTAHSNDSCPPARGSDNVRRGSLLLPDQAVQTTVDVRKLDHTEPII